MGQGRRLGKRRTGTAPGFIIPVLFFVAYNAVSLFRFTEFTTGILGKIQDVPVYAAVDNGVDDSNAPPSFVGAADHSEIFLVVCYNIHGSFTPIFDNFTVVRLLKNDTPPSWNATAFLYGKDCVDHPYVAEAMERRERSPLVSYSTKNHAVHNATWVRGVRWPPLQYDGGDNRTVRQHVLRTIHDRPAIIGVPFGEVFWRIHYKSCKEYDFVVYREVETVFPDCFTVHFLQGVAFAMMRGMEGAFGARHTTQILTKAIPHPHKANRTALVADHYHGLCSFLVRKSLNNTVEIFSNRNYDIDAIVRQMFFLQLGEYKPCQRITDCDAKGPQNAFKCMTGYKFHITMENTLLDGYVSEKIFNGALGGGIPIYFGASDIGNYVNDKSIIHCNIERDIIEEMRSFYPRGNNPRPFLFGSKLTSLTITNDEIIPWAAKYLRPQLDVCIQRVIELDENDDKFMAMVNEPFLKRGDIMNGIYPLQGVALAYNFLRNSHNNLDARP